MTNETHHISILTLFLIVTLFLEFEIFTLKPIHFFTGTALGSIQIMFNLKILHSQN